MSSDFPYVVELDQQIRRITSVVQPAEVFKVLMEIGGLAAPRTAVFLIRRGQIQGWGSIGYAAEPAGNLRRLSVNSDAGWLQRLLASDEPILFRQGSESSPDFGQPRASEVAGCVLRIKGKAIGLIMIERIDASESWFPQVLALAVTVGQLRLELDVAQRRAQSLTEQSAARPAAAPPTPPVASVPSIEPVTDPIPTVSAPVSEMVESNATEDVGVPPADPTSSLTAPETSATVELAEVPDPEDAEEARKLEAARRYARLVATDIRLYNEEAVVLGRKNGDLTHRIGDHLGRGKEAFLRRHGNMGPTGMEILHAAFVQVLAGGDEKLIPRNTLE